MKTIRRGLAWAVVCKMSGEVVHKIQTTASRIDRVVGGMLINMSPDYFVDEWYEFPRKGEKNKDGKVS